MITQQEFVEGCQRYYAENYYEPGNPEDGIWHDCHYPTPKCLGGTETVKLLKEHHAVHGVLQSEEFSRPCIWGWEEPYLTGEMLALCKKWQSEKGKIWVKNTPRETLVERANKVLHLAHAARRRSVVVTTDSGTTTYESVKDAARALHVHYSLISNWLGGRRHTYVDYGVTVAWADE